MATIHNFSDTKEQTIDVRLIFRPQPKVKNEIKTHIILYVIAKRFSKVDKNSLGPSCPPCQIGLIIAQVDIDDFQTDTVDI